MPTPRALAIRLVILVLLGIWVWVSLDRPVHYDFFGPEGALRLPKTAPAGPPESFMERAVQVTLAGCVVPAGSVLTLDLGESGLTGAVLVPPPDAEARGCLEAALAAAPWPAVVTTVELPLGG